MEEILDILIMLKIEPNSNETIGSIIKKNKYKVISDFNRYTVFQFLGIYKINQLIKNNIVTSDYGKVIEGIYFRYLEIEKELSELENNNTHNKHIEFINSLKRIFTKSLKKYHIIDYNINYENISDQMIKEEFQGYEKIDASIDEIYNQLHDRLR